MLKRSWLKKLKYGVCFLGIVILIEFPIAAEGYYSPMDIFQPSAGSEICYENSNTNADSKICYRNSNDNLVDTIKGENNLVNFAAELEEAGLTKLLSSKEIKYTVFAPLDTAYDALSEEDFDKIRKLEDLKRVLEYHLVDRKISEDDIDKKEIESIEGNYLSIIVNSDRSLMINDAKVEPPSIVATNGVIIAIDKILFP